MTIQIGNTVGGVCALTVACLMGISAVADPAVTSAATKTGSAGSAGLTCEVREQATFLKPITLVGTSDGPNLVVVSNYSPKTLPGFKIRVELLYNMPGQAVGEREISILVFPPETWGPKGGHPGTFTSASYGLNTFVHTDKDRGVFWMQCKSVN